MLNASLAVPLISFYVSFSCALQQKQFCVLLPSLRLPLFLLFGSSLRQSWLVNASHQFRQPEARTHAPSPSFAFAGDSESCGYSGMTHPERGLMTEDTSPWCPANRWFVGSGLKPVRLPLFR
jgi:hypothetical protein